MYESEKQVLKHVLLNWSKKNRIDYNYQMRSIYLFREVETLNSPPSVTVIKKMFKIIRYIDCLVFSGLLASSSASFVLFTFSPSNLTSNSNLGLCKNFNSVIYFLPILTLLLDFEIFYLKIPELNIRHCGLNTYLKDLCYTNVWGKMC